MESSNIYEIIKEECKEQFNFSERIEQYVEGILLNNINDFKKENIDPLSINEKELDLALSLLIAQGIRTYKSNLILVKEGYASNALAGLRSLVEIIFNIEYILENEKFKYKRANNYLNNRKSDKVWKKAELSLNRELYKAYVILCEFSHFNLKATQHNVNDNKINVSSDNSMTEATATFVNSVYYYFILIVCDYYSISTTYLENIDIPQQVKTLVDSYSTEKDVVDTFMNIISSAGIDKGFALEEYKKYKIDEEEKKKKQKRKKRK